MSMIIFDKNIIKDFQFRYYIDREACVKIKVIDMAGEYIQKRLSEFGTYPKDYEWFVMSDMYSDVNDLCFRVGNKTYSVLIEILEEYKEDNSTKLKFLEHCKENNLIPCFFPITPKLLVSTTNYGYGIYVNDDGIPDFTFEIGCFTDILEEDKETEIKNYINKPNKIKMHNGKVFLDIHQEITELIKKYKNLNNWNLIDPITRKPIFPNELVSDEIINLSDYEQNILSVRMAIDFLIEKNIKITSYSDTIHPQILFEDGKSYYIWVHTFKTDEEFNNMNDHIEIYTTNRVIVDYIQDNPGWFYGVKYKDLSRTGKRPYKYKRYPIKRILNNDNFYKFELYTE